MALALLNRSIERRLRQNEGLEQSINGTRDREQQRSYPVDINAKNNSGETPLTVALTHTTGEMSYKLLEAGAEPDDEAILIAARSGQTATVNLLLSRGASATWQNRYYGAFPLLVAVEKGHRETVEILLRKAPAAVEMEATGGLRALETAIRKDRTEIAMLLIKEGSFQPSSAALAEGLSRAIEKDMLDLVEIILRKDVSLVDIELDPGGASGESGWRPFSLAAVYGSEAIVKLLLKAGANPELTDDFGRTPLSCAAANGREAVVKLLLKIGANLESKDSSSLTPLSWAARNGHEAVVKLLPQAGANPDNGLSQTPLQWAAEEGHEAVVKLLLEAGANLESKCGAGGTPLSDAAWNGHYAVVRLLLEAGANPESKGVFNKTPLLLAAENGDKAVVKLLLQWGANPEDCASRVALQFSSYISASVPIR